MPDSDCNPILELKKLLSRMLLIWLGRVTVFQKGVLDVNKYPLSNVNTLQSQTV